MNFYTSTLEEYQFFKGDTFSIPFIANNEDGEMVDLSRHEVRLYLFPYGQYGMPVQFEENDYKHDTVYLLTFDTNNTKKSFLNINNLGYLLIKKINRLGEQIDIQSNDIIKNVGYFYQIKKSEAENSLLLLSEDLKELHDNSHSHENKAILDSVSTSKVNEWNSAYTHTSDKIAHIISAERATWNTVSEKLPLSGGKLTNYLTLHSKPTQDFHAATKKYVDDASSVSINNGIQAYTHSKAFTDYCR